MEVQGGRIRRPVASGKIERGIILIALVGTLGWVPYMITYWMAHGWPAYPETYFVGLVVIPAAIFAAGRLLAFATTQIKRWRRGGF